MLTPALARLAGPGNLSEMATYRRTRGSSAGPGATAGADELLVLVLPTINDVLDARLGGRSSFESMRIFER